ncbi:glycosyltransferase family 4 protein [Bacillus mobilis]|uniref:glycosyltransferase family 4 protein n=1 Tax=Bacillus mobilis TaxID=2026190 RepID=UPI0022E64F70|nr:glycosyltransferase family 4 protein [Bacillus mobilis]
MKTVIITQGKVASGAEIVTNELYKDKKDSVYVFSGSEKQVNYFQDNDFNVKNINGLIPLERENFKVNKLFKVLGSLSEIRRNIKEISPDFIHVNNIPALLYTYLSTMKLNIPIVLQVHDFYSKDKLVKGIAKFLKNKPHKIIAVSNSVSEDLKSLGFNDTKIEVVHNGISIETKPRELKRNPKIRIGFVGSIARWKGLHIFLEAAYQLNNMQEDIEFVIVGPFLDEHYRNEIEILGQKVKSKVRFLGKRTDARELMQTFDVLVHCSIEHDPFPTVILEGMHSGCAVIGANCGGVPEMIINNKTGLIHQVGSSDELADCLKKLVINQDFRENISANGYKFAKEYLTGKRFREEFFEKIDL